MNINSTLSRSFPPLLAAIVLAGCGVARTAGGQLGLSLPAGEAASSHAPSEPVADDRAASGARAPAGRPSWCDDFNYARSTSYTADWFDDVDEAGMVRTGKVAEVLGEAVCATDWEAPRERDRMMAIRARWMTAMGYDEADFAVAAGEARGYVEDAQDLATVTGPAAQLAEGQPDLDELGVRGSVLRRFALVHGCLQVALDTPPEDLELLAVILCTRERLDVAAALAEIEASRPLTPRSRKDLRHMVKRAAVAAATASAWVASRASGDPGIAKLVAIADAQFAEWATPTPARAKLMDTLEVMEAAARSGKRSAFAGCDARTRAAWEAVVRPRTRPKTGSADLVQTYVEPALGSADGYLAYQALSLCSAASESSRHRASLIDSSAIRRGPRSATRAAWIAASGEIAFDDRALSLASLLGAFGAESPATIAGVIDTITDRGGEVEISFKPQLAKVDDCLSSRDTAQIERIDDSGHVYYRRVCVTWGKRTIDNAPEPVLAGKVMAHGLARGMYLTALDDGTPLVATSGPSSTAPVWLLGATL